MTLGDSAGHVRLPCVLLEEVATELKNDAEKCKCFLGGYGEGEKTQNNRKHWCFNRP